MKLIGEIDIQIPLFQSVRPRGQESRHLFTFFHCQDLAEVKYSLLPVGIFRVRTCRKGDRLMASAEFNIEPCDEGVDKIRSSDLQGVWCRKSKLGCRDCIEIDAVDT